MLVPSTNGVTVAVHHLGGDGEPLLICHATGFCGQAYGPLAVDLTSRFTVWAIDFRGHGDSTSPASGDFAWTGMADDLLAVADALDVSGVVGFGHSMGGGVLLLAELARPGFLKSCYLYEPIVVPAGYWGPGAENPMAEGSRRRRQVFASKAEALLRYASRPPLGSLRADALAAYVLYGFSDESDGTVRLKCRPEDEARTFETASKAVMDQIVGLKVRTVVAVGGRDAGQGPAEFGPAVVAAMPNARLVEYDHLGHFGPLQDPDTVAADILADLGGGDTGFAEAP